MILWLKSDFRHLTGFRYAYTLVRKVLGSAALWQSGTSDTGRILLAPKERCSSESNTDTVNRDTCKFGRPCLAR